MNRFAILGAMGLAVIVAALLLNYAINRNEVGETGAPMAPTTAPAEGTGQPAAAASGSASSAAANSAGATSSGAATSGGSAGAATTAGSTSTAAASGGAGATTSGPSSGTGDASAPAAGGAASAAPAAGTGTATTAGPDTGTGQSGAAASGGSQSSAAPSSAGAATAAGPDSGTGGGSAVAAGESASGAAPSSSGASTSAGSGNAAGGTSAAAGSGSGAATGSGSDQGAASAAGTSASGAAATGTTGTTGGAAGSGGTNLASAAPSAGGGSGDSASAATGPAPIKPSFDIVRVNPDGSTVIAGRAAPHAVVTITADSQKIGTVEADDRGEWVLVPQTKLAPGNHQIAITSQLGAGAPVPSDDIVVVVVPQPQVAVGGNSTGGGTQSAATQPQQPLAVVVPRTDQGSTVLQAPNPPQSGQLVLQSVDYDRDGKVIIGGKAAAGKGVRAYLDNVLIGSAKTDSSGLWHITPTGPVPPGLHVLRIDEVDDNGKVLARVESPFSRAEPLNIAEGDQVVVVQPGNNLWLIATRTYGSGFRYTVIYQANKTQIKDPDLIYPGQVFKLPTTAAP